jgi:benzoyl-CoA reductase/2-hydroxyglutaryl-CoA dehydratase subunit BcrC/BadD/HgdB
MNIADEYFAMRNDKEKFSSDIEGKVQSIIELVDEELN